jgi:hypothetical protein
MRNVTCYIVLAEAHGQLIESPNFDLFRARFDPLFADGPLSSVACLDCHLRQESVVDPNEPLAPFVDVVLAKAPG